MSIANVLLINKHFQGLSAVGIFLLGSDHDCLKYMRVENQEMIKLESLNEQLIFMPHMTLLLLLLFNSQTNSQSRGISVSKLDNFKRKENYSNLELLNICIAK
jgi:hypothetical protein